MASQWSSVVTRRLFVAAWRPPTAALAPVACGGGDKKTQQGKWFKWSYENAQPKKEKKVEWIKDKVEVLGSTHWPLPFKLIRLKSCLFCVSDLHTQRRIQDHGMCPYTWNVAKKHQDYGYA